MGRVQGLVEGFATIDPERGATASIITDYLCQLEIEPDERTVTALAHGIYSDTLNLDPANQRFAQEDVDNLGYLFQYLDQSILGEVIGSDLTKETANTMMRGLQNKEEENTYAVSYVGWLNQPGAINNTADFLGRLKGNDTVVVYGLSEGDDQLSVRLSARNTDIQRHVGHQLEDAVELDSDRFSSAGGSINSAGGNIPIEALGRAPEDLQFLERDEIEEWTGIYMKSIISRIFDS